MEEDSVMCFDNQNVKYEINQFLLLKETFI